MVRKRGAPQTSNIMESINRQLKRRTNVISLLLMFLCLLVPACKERAPLKVSFRDSLLSGKVLQVRNTSDSAHLYCKVRAKNYTEGSKASYSFTLGPRDMKEVGLLEMDWAFNTGESVTIEVEGFSDLSFEVP